jgi:C1A family cysteine protease
MKRHVLVLTALLCLTPMAQGAFKDTSRMSDKEMIEYYVANGGGLIASESFRFDNNAKWIRTIPRGPLPAEFDLRTLHPSGGLQPIKRQRCGDCWAHSVLATLETAWALKNPTKDFEIYAQQEMISSCGGTGGSCNGGYFKAFDYVVGNSGDGLPMEDDLPYKGSGSKCNTDVEKKPRALEWAYVGDQWDMRGASIEEMKQALIDHGSLSVDVHAFNHTGDEVYEACSGGSVNHMVNIEGYHDDENVQGGGYWIMRNSWGDSFGEGGYAKVAYLNKSGQKCSQLGHTTAVITKLQ